MYKTEHVFELEEQRSKDIFSVETSAKNGIHPQTCCKLGMEVYVLHHGEAPRIPMTSCVHHFSMQTQYFRWHVLRPEITNHSCPSTEQITNLVQCKVATGVTPTCHTLNSLVLGCKDRIIMVVRMTLMNK